MYKTNSVADNMYYDPVKRLPYFYGLGEFGFSARFTTNRQVRTNYIVASSLICIVNPPRINCSSRLLEFRTKRN